MFRLARILRPPHAFPTINRSTPLIFNSRKPLDVLVVSRPASFKRLSHLAARSIYIFKRLTPLTAKSREPVAIAIVPWYIQAPPLMKPKQSSLLFFLFLLMCPECALAILTVWMLFVLVVLLCDILAWIRERIREYIQKRK